MNRNFDPLDVDIPLSKYPSMLGFDDFVNRAKEHLSRKDTTYPPHNVIRSGSAYIIEFALAGFRREQIDVTLTERLLTVSATAAGENQTEDVVYLHKGIAQRSFTKQFLLNDNIEVLDAQMSDGLLRIYLSERKKPTRKINVGNGHTAPSTEPREEKVLLNEDAMTDFALRMNKKNLDTGELVDVNFSLDEYAALEQDPIAKSEDVVNMTPPRKAEAYPDELDDSYVRLAANALSTKE